ncbi:MAG: class I SAM-dependent methyltransferase [bacterium]|nr:MAG: class I SAM-dependent methyltransferase [bacterium]
MSKLKLYSDLAEIYDQLYLNIFNYEQDAEFVDSILKKYHITEFLELGCGSGHLAQILVKKGYKITGVDLYEEMLQIARKRLPEVEFVQQDIRTLKFDRKFDAIIAMGRMYTYMTTNDDVEQSIGSIANCLNPGGIFLFDNFSAPHFIKNFEENKEMNQEVDLGDRKIKRISKKTWNLKHGVTFNWPAKYYIEEKGRTQEIDDQSVLRTFFPEELEYFLNRKGLQVIEMFDHDFAFTILSQKKI